MRHRNSGRKLGRTSAHRKALFKNMATALLTYGRITTTEAKAKEIRGVVEPLITLAQTNDLHSRREAYRVLGNHKLVKRLFDEIGPIFKDMDKGGYTRVVKLALPRKGDCASMAVIELVKGKHYEKVALGEASDTQKVDKVDKVEGEAKAETAATVKPKKAPKAKAPAKPKAVKSDIKSSKVAGSKPKSTPRKMEG